MYQLNIDSHALLVQLSCNGTSFMTVYSIQYTLTLCVRSLNILSLFKAASVQSSSRVMVTFCENIEAGLLKKRDKY